MKITAIREICCCWFPHSKRTIQIKKYKTTATSRIHINHSLNTSDSLPFCEPQQGAVGNVISTPATHVTVVRGSQQARVFMRSAYPVIE